MRSNKTVQADWNCIYRIVGDINREVDNRRNTLLGRFFREWVAESDHQGWDGWDHRQQSVIRKALADFALYVDGCLEEGGKEEFFNETPN